MEDLVLVKLSVSMSKFSQNTQLGSVKSIKYGKCQQMGSAKSFIGVVKIGQTFSMCAQDRQNIQQQQERPVFFCKYILYELCGLGLIKPFIGVVRIGQIFSGCNWD